MIKLAKQMEDVKREVDALNILVEFATNRAEFTKAERHGKAALRLARKANDKKLEADGLLSQGDIFRNTDDAPKSEETLKQALRLYRELDDRAGEAAVLRRSGRNLIALGDLAGAQTTLRHSIEITRSLGDRYEEAFALAVLSLSYSDMADQRTYGEQSLEIFSAIRDRIGQSMLYNNLGLMYGHLGLYGTAKDYTEHAVEMAREMRVDLRIATYLESLGRAELDHREYEQARITMQEGLELSLKIEHDLNEAYFRLGLARIAYAAGEPKVALSNLQRSCDLFREIGSPAELSISQAWLGYTYLALNDWDAAHEHTSRAVADMEALGDVSSDYPPQEVWWLHYQVLKATPEEKSPKADSKLDVSQLTDTYAWMVLQRARQIALTGIATLSDEGLRRNYLNKVEVNRELIAEWVRGAEARDLDLELESAHAGNLQDQLKRMLAIGARMNERRDLDGLLDFIMDQLVELSGAERVLLADISEEDVRQALAVRGYSNEDAKTALDATSFVFDMVSERLNPVLLQRISAADPKTSEPESILDSLSVLGLPLISQGQLTGLIYLDNHTIYGPFNQSDVDLLSAFANQAASALENARLYQDLEQRVADRTDELETANKEMEQRAAELQIINSVQEGLASKLDMQAIYELIGDRIGEIFNADTTLIGFHDDANNEIYAPYYKDKGQVWTDSRRPYGQGLAEVILESGLPLKFDTSQESNEVGMYHVPSPDSEEDLNESIIAVPILSGGKAVGITSVQSYKQAAFDENDVNLLQTLTNAMSAALENVRLFDETQHLLRETEQRAAELSIINSVQDGLASQLDFDGIIDLVGDKMRDVFGLQNLDIRIYDPSSNLMHFKYFVEGGKRLPPPEPSEPAGFGGRVLETREPIVVNDHMEEAMEEVGSYIFEGTEFAKSLMAVPIISGDQATGIIMVDDLERENAFDESDVRLLTTLAASMGVAFENARLFAETTRLLGETEERAAELEIISSVEQALASKLEIQEVFDLLGDKIRDVFDAQVLVIVTYDSVSDMIAYSYLIERGKRLYPESDLLGDIGFAAHIIHNRVPLIINRDMNERAKEYGAQIVAGEPIKSFLGVPLIIGQEANGVISLQNLDHEDAFDEADLRLLTTLASSMSVALENVRLFEETRRRAAEMAALAEIAREVSATLDLTAVLEQIGDRAMELLNARMINLRLLDVDDLVLKSVVSLGRHAEQYAAQDLALGEGVSGTVGQTGKPELIADTRDSKRTVNVPGTPEDEPETFMVVPLTVGDEIIGTMGVWRAFDEGSFSNDDLELLISLSRQAAIAIQNARLFHEVDIQKEYSQSLVINSPVAIVTIDEADEIVSWNPEAEDLFGYTGDEVIGQNIDELLVPEDIRGEAIDLNRQSETEGSVQITTKRQRKDGSLVDVELHGVALFEDGKAAGSIAIYHNISELKQAEEEMRSQKDYLEALVAHSPVAIIATDLGTSDSEEPVIVGWNPAAEELFGYSAEEAIGQGLDDLVAAREDMKEEAGSYNQVGFQGEFVRGITRRTRKDGTLVDVEILALPIMVGSEQAGIIVIYHDISELVLAQHAAEAANEAKSAFLATMSHEIRTPMNAIIGMTSLLLDTELTDEQREFTEIVRDSSDSLLTIINDILDFSKIEAGKFELESQPFDLRECIEGALDLIAPKASEKRIDIAYEYAEGTPEAIHGDVTRLRQIFVNLLNNAVKFTEEGEVVVEVEPNDGKRNELQFCIRDTGIGIPPERMDRLFQSFSQVDISTSRKYGGTGLGLAISKRLSELMGGTMWVESTPGEGSTFHFTIAAKPAPSPKRAYSDAELPELVGKKVLIVDDNATNRKILTRQVQSWEMSYKDTDSPKEALKWLAADETFDTAVLDMHMPGMDGVELALEIRKTDGGKELPLLMLTSLGGREKVRAEERVEFAAFLTKPIKPSQLFNALSRVFVADVEPSQPKAEAPALDSHMADRLPLRILLAEDNVINQKVAMRILDRLGYRADIAGNGLEAIDALERQPYDVILMDMQMPELDGLDATRRIRKEIAGERQPRIIATTANAMEGDRELCLEAGMDDYVSKPLRVDELVRALSESHQLEGT